ncbi:hypothetical protein N8Z70_02415 [Candidatus Puniceispirillum sp.]|nr:hypothetical protein [bacterium]MDC0650078.1 hypothetical protein [Alphaproteobacteria bacterium]MDC1293881.1 hypothetical protein [Candidatus Puniceispirillum sp.]
MRLFFSTVILLLSLSSNAHAFSGGDLYKKCKPFADRAFEAKTIDDLSCVTYFRGIADGGYRLCLVLKGLITMSGVTRDDKDAYEAVMINEGLGATNADQLLPAIQMFVNEMAAEPEKWKGSAVFVTHKSLKKVAPCE